MGSLAGLRRIVMGTAERRTRRALNSLLPIMKSHSSPNIVLAFSRASAALVNDGPHAKHDVRPRKSTTLLRECGWS